MSPTATTYTSTVPMEALATSCSEASSPRAPPASNWIAARIRDTPINAILTAPRSPTTTGKVERWHKTLRREFLSGKVFASIADAQEQLDRWVHDYNFERRHQGIGDVAPWERFRLAVSEPADPVEPTEEPMTTRRVGKTGKISFAAQLYPVGVWLAGETVEVSVANGLVSIHHRGVLVATHAQRHPLIKESAALARTVKQKRPRPRQATVGQSVTRKVDSSGNVSFAGHSYRISKKHARRQVQVAIVGDTVEISAGGSRSIPSGTTAHARTAPSPTPAAPPAPTPPETPTTAGTQLPEPIRNTGTGP